MRIPYLSVFVGFLALVASPGFAQLRDYSKSLAPYVPSPQRVVVKMLEAAEVKPGETVYDLGSGDGRVLIAAAKKFNANAVGVEISSELVQSARQKIKEAGVEEKCKLIQGDAREVDLSPADVVVLYLLTSSNELLRPNIEKSLKDGARVVSHEFEVKGWKPTRIIEAEAHGRTHKIFVYRMPISR